MPIKLWNNDAPPLGANKRNQNVRSNVGWLGYLLPTILSIASLTIVWEAWTRVANVPSYIVPAPTTVFLNLVGNSHFFMAHGTSTVITATSGFIIGTLLGLVLAGIMAQSRFLERSLLPITIVTRVVPLIVWALMFVLWFGFGFVPKILIVALITFFPIMTNCLTGIKSVDPGTLDFFRSVNASRMEILLLLRLPSSLPYLFAAFRTTIPLSVIGAFVGEMFLGNRGLGNVILVAHNNLDTPTAFAAILLLVLISIILIVITSVFERRFLFWHNSVISD